MERGCGDLKPLQSGGIPVDFGGSYGWSSAGRFHHAQSQVHRFLNLCEGYVRSVDSYSLGAGRALMPAIVAPMDELNAAHTSWEMLEGAHGALRRVRRPAAQEHPRLLGGAGDHRARDALRRLAAAGTRFVNVGPVNDNLETGGPVEWIPIRPNTDVAMMLALAHVVLHDPRFDRGFLDRCCTGFDRFVPYLTGTADGVPKDSAWAEGITGMPAARIASLARAMLGARTMVNSAYALQRAAHGEQPFWMTVTLAAMLGQIGLPGGGFGLGCGSMNTQGTAHPAFSGPSLPQGPNAVEAFIPVARIADMLLDPDAPFTYRGETRTYPEIRLVYWAGGNPFHHHQDLRRLRRAGSGRRRSWSTSRSGPPRRVTPTSCCPRRRAWSATTSASPPARGTWSRCVSRRRARRGARRPRDLRRPRRPARSGRGLHRRPRCARLAPASLRRERGARGRGRDPYLAIAQSREDVRLLVTSKDVLDVRTDFLANRGFASRHPKLLEDAVAGLREAAAWADGHKEAVARSPT